MSQLRDNIERAGADCEAGPNLARAIGAVAEDQGGQIATRDYDEGKHGGHQGCERWRDAFPTSQQARLRQDRGIVLGRATPFPNRDGGVLPSVFERDAGLQVRHDLIVLRVGRGARSADSQWASKWRPGRRRARTATGS